MFITINIHLLMQQIHFGKSLRFVKYRVEFPTNTNCTASSGELTKKANVKIETGETALDVMIAAADKDSNFNFKSTYFGNSGYFIDSIAGIASSDPCYWFFYYIIPGLPETKSSLGVSNVVIPGSGWTIIMRYEEFLPDPGHSS